MPLDEVTRDAINAELGRRRMSQRALARELGWSQTYLRLRLSGRYPLTTRDIQAIADALGMPVTRFLPAPERAA